ncbi:hypothetical protein [Rhodococcus opacus]|uniref:Uncharacterized protein n=1 Tax=Rhodococcus opacus (strain B4) TaxID=632772 RepID=C1B9A2_RHOOB|nr:hypothetical protein [Rhodococcus opacus]BAH52255.1 hypothetical protein ROP_40080 [Rhodococcus opacus B4]
MSTDANTPIVPAAYADVTYGEYADNVQHTAKPNAALLNTVLAHIKANPDEWYQGDWRAPRTYLYNDADGSDSPCGTAMCFAGWTVELTGGKFAHPADSSGYAEGVFTGSVDDYGTGHFDDTAENAHVVETDEGLVHVEQYAMKALGLGIADARLLFHGSNTLEDLHRRVDYLVARAEGRTP